MAVGPKTGGTVVDAFPFGITRISPSHNDVFNEAKKCVHYR